MPRPHAPPLREQEVVMLAMTYLHTEVGEQEQAKDALISLSESHLLSWAQAHFEFLLDSDMGQFTGLGEVTWVIEWGPCTV